MWQLEKVMAKIQKKITENFHKIHSEVKKRDTDWRTAAFILAISRIETAYKQRGIFP